MAKLQFVTVDPGHFHAALVQKEMYAQVDKTVHIFAPLGTDLLGHLQRLVGFNTRTDRPTDWRTEIHASPDYLDRFASEKPGNVAIFAGRNRKKIDYIERAINAGLNVLSDKPWIIVPEDLPRLKKVFETAESKGLIAYDIMTERFEITSLLQREMVQDEAVFGEMLKGSVEEPAVYIESVHFLKKLVAGMPLRRPAWYFDVEMQGEGLSDVGTHLVDIVYWMLFPEQAIDIKTDVQLNQAKRWPTQVSRADFCTITGEAGFPDYLKSNIEGDSLAYHCNTQVHYAVRGVHVKLDVLWGLEAEAGSGDSHFAVFRGSKSRVEIRQGKEENLRPELYVLPRNPGDKAALQSALEKKIAALQSKYAGVGMRDAGDKFHITIPDRFRVGHEAHFGQVTNQFLRYLQKEATLPAWENPNMLAKYYVTTQGVALSRK